MDIHTDYSFDATANGEVSPKLLHAEIVEDSTLEIVFKGVVVDVEDRCIHIYTTSELSAAAKTILDGIIAAHSGVKAEVEMALIEKLAIIKDQQDKRINAGVEFDGNLFASDDRGQSRMIGALVNLLLHVVIAQQPVADWSVDWRSKTGQVTLTAASIANLANVMAAHVAAHVYSADDLENQVKALAALADTTPEQINAFDHMQGWP